MAQPASSPPTVQQVLATLPETATPADRRSALEKLARDLKLPRTREEWAAFTADLGPTAPEDAHMGEELAAIVEADRLRRRALGR